MSTSTVERTVGRTLVEPDLFRKLADRLVIDENLDRSLAERIVDQALAFLKACADHPGRGLAPSQLVDLGWHAFVLHTRDYAAFCDAVAGRFIHHVPTEGHQPGDDPHQVLDTTMAAIRDAGMVVDTELWQIGSSGPQDPPQPKCHQCHAGCHDSA